MTIDFLYSYIAKQKHAVISTVNSDNLPESALVGIAVTKDLKIIFDTVTTSRKYQNLVQNPAIALVIGSDNEQTLQYEGIAHIPEPKELEELLQSYFAVFPEGKDRRENWKNIAYFCVEPKWVRYSDFAADQIEERSFEAENGSIKSTA